MTDKKVSALQTLTAPNGLDLLYVIDDPAGTPVSKKISLDQLLASLPSNTTVNAKLTVTGNTSLTGANVSVTYNFNVSGNTNLGKTTIQSNSICIEDRLTPANSTITIKQGSIFYDNNYIYVAYANNMVKRATLNSF